MAPRADSQDKQRRCGRSAGSCSMGVIYVATLAHRGPLLVVLFAVFAVLPHAETAQMRTPSDREKAEEVWKKATMPDTTQYGQPQVLVQSLTTSVDHFSQVTGDLSTSSDCCRWLRNCHKVVFPTTFHNFAGAIYTEQHI